MALKRQQRMLDTFSMASMTDVVFLLLVFFMVTSTYIFPTALEVNLPQGGEQTPLKPVTRIYVTEEGNVSGQYGDSEAIQFASQTELNNFLAQIAQTEGDQTSVALYADTEVNYGRVVDILQLGAQNNIKIVLATTPRTVAETADGDEVTFQASDIDMTGTETPDNNQ